MKNSLRTDAMRRHVAAIHISMSGPTHSEFLDTRHVLVGAGAGIPEEHRPQFAEGLAQQRRSMIFFVFEPGNFVVQPIRTHVAEPDGKGGIHWYEDCTLWTAGPTAEMSLVPAVSKPNGRYVNRAGRLRYEAFKVTDRSEGARIAKERFRHTVGALTPADYAGQNLVNEEAGESWWQHRGFAIRV